MVSMAPLPPLGWKVRVSFTASAAMVPVPVIAPEKVPPLIWPLVLLVTVP